MIPILIHPRWWIAMLDTQQNIYSPLIQGQMWINVLNVLDLTHSSFFTSLKSEPKFTMKSLCIREIYTDLIVVM